MLKITVLITCLFFQSVLLANEQNAWQNFAERKAMRLKEIDERIAQMNEVKACVSAANDQSGMKVCGDKMKEFHQENRMEHLEQRKNRLEKRMENLKKKSGQ